MKGLIIAILMVICFGLTFYAREISSREAKLKSLIEESQTLNTELLEQVKLRDELIKKLEARPSRIDLTVCQKEVLNYLEKLDICRTDLGKSEIEKELLKLKRDIGGK